MTESLGRIFEPGSVAIVGASADPTKRGHQVLLALRDSGFAGDVYPVNPKGGTIAGFDVVRSVDDLSSGVDLAVLCTPASMAPDLVRACGRRSVGAALVLAVGFGESGGDGEDLEAELVRAGAEASVRIVGPNTSGLLNMATGLNLVGARDVREGGIALLLQSGNVALQLMTEVTERSWDGVSVYLGVGNQIDVGSVEALEFLADHGDTRSVVVYLEALPDARSWLGTAARVARTKPIVAIKSGRTKEGSAAARSHTGSVAGPYDRFSAGLAQAGVVEVTRTDELLHVAHTLGRQPTGPVQAGIAVLSDGGGHGALVADALAEAGARISRLSAVTRERLQERLGPAAATGNPVDLAGASDADPMAFVDALDALVDDPSVGTILVVGLFGGYGVRFSEALVPRETEAAVAMAERAGAAERGLIVHTMYAAHRTEPLEALGTRHVPVVGSLDVATRCAIELQRRGDMIARPVWRPDESAGVEPSEVARRLIDEVSSQGRRALDEVEARRVLGSYGLHFPEHVEVSTAAEAADAVTRIGRSSALKLISNTVLHKSDSGGVRLSIDSPDEAAAAFEAIRNDVTAWRVRHGLEPEAIRVMISPMLSSPRVELLVGGTRDESLGPVLTLGAGGIWVEALGDVAHRVLPVTDEEIVRALEALRVSPILDAGRGHAAVERGPLVSAARAVARVLEAHPAVAEIELNPVFVHDTGIEAVDARIVLGG